MPELVVKFIGHITPDGIMAGLPREIVVMHYTKAETREELVQFIERHAVSFVQMQCMTADKNPQKLATLDSWESEKIIVPFGVIGWIETEVKQLVGEMPRPDENGQQKFADGQDPLKQ